MQYAENHEKRVIVQSHPLVNHPITSPGESFPV